MFIQRVPTHPEPLRLAQTGFDITVPIILGIAALLLGIALVSWAFLRKPRPRPARRDDARQDH